MRLRVKNRRLPGQTDQRSYELFEGLFNQTSTFAELSANIRNQQTGKKKNPLLQFYEVS